MALATNQVDINRTSGEFALPAELSSEIIQGTVHASTVAQLATPIALPGRGLSIPVITGDAVADFVAESAEKPVSNATFEPKIMTPYKIAVIELFSREFMRDLPALYDALVARLPYAIGKKLDETVLGGTAPGTGFDVLSGSTAVDISSDTYKKAVAAKVAIASSGNNRLSGWAISPLGEGLLESTTDEQGRPLFIQNVNTDGAVNAILGAPAYITNAALPANTVGYAGDWSKARFGIVEGIDVSISQEATVNDGTNQVNLWQRNMFAVRAEAEVGFIVADTDAFVKLTAAQSSGE